MPSNKKLLQAAAGSAGGDNLFPEDVFSTFLYTGNSTARSINNGLDLSGEGGLVWIKNRTSSGSDDHVLYDTERGVNKYLSSNSTATENSGNTQGLMTFNNNGFSLGTDNYWNVNRTGTDIASWSFRKAAGFCDIVTYSGDSSASKQISHNLGSTPAMILIKRTDGAVNWAVFHKDLSGSNGTGKGFLSLNTNDNNSVNTNCFSTLPTSTEFTVNANYGGTNASGASYVAYLFGDDAIFGEDGDEQICKMGSYTADSSNAYFVDLGFEPQWVIIKKTSGDGNWELLDTMRGFGADAANDQILKANSSNAEASDYGAFISSTGFYGSNQSGANGSTYIYMAIRRPMKVPEAGTEVFAIDTAGSVDSNKPQYRSGFPVDMVLERPNVSGSENMQSGSRLTQGKFLRTNLTNAEASFPLYQFDYMNGYYNSNTTISSYYAWMFKRASKFMDVVAYTGDGTSNRAVAHNLTVVPEMMVGKNRSSSSGWAVYHTGSLYQSGSPLNLNSSASGVSNTYDFGGASGAAKRPDASSFYLGSANINSTNDNYITYLFATLAGISKVGSVVHSGTTNVDCGFSAGARFVLVKRTDSTGGWYVWDSVRGIVSGNDPYLLLNSTAAQVTNTDHIDPLASGFTLTSSFTAGTYIFLAIA